MSMTAVQYSIGGTPIAIKTNLAAGFERRAEFPCMWTVLRPGYRLRNRGSANPLRSVAQAAKDLGRYVSRFPRAPGRSLEIERVAQFGAEADAIVDSWPEPLIFTTRSSELLNYYLRFPGDLMSGWLFREAGRPVGFAVLNVLPTHTSRLGNVVECFIESPDVDLWHAAIMALTHQLYAQGADLAQCLASTSWAEQACLRAGYRPTRDPTILLLRDPDRILPRDLCVSSHQTGGGSGLRFLTRVPGSTTQERGLVAVPVMGQRKATLPGDTAQGFPRLSLKLGAI
jgi:hypothetical protein